MSLPSSFFAFMKGLGFEPRRLSLYELAFTHPSSIDSISEERKDYERLEFLGDSLMGFVVSELAYRYHPEMEEGNLSVIKSQLIRTESEAGYALRLGLLPFVKVGPSFQKKIEDSPSVLEDIFESFLGALFLDQGLDKTYDFLFSFLEDEVARSVPLLSKNPKSELQEALQSDHREAVSYRLLEEMGPSHSKRFLVSVNFEGEEIGRGVGSSKKEAEQEAARAALSRRATAGKGPFVPALGWMKDVAMSSKDAAKALGID